VSTDTIERAGGHYTIISADCHAGGSHQAYREYLDPAYLEDFDAWRAKYKNPVRQKRAYPARGLGHSKSSAL